MILHLNVANVMDTRLGTRLRRSATARSLRTVALPPRAPKSVDPRISLPLAVRGANGIVAFLDGILT